MNRTANLTLLVFAIATLICTVASGQVAAQTVTVSPENPMIGVGETQQFTVTGIDAATAIEAGSFHQCALVQDGSVRCWGLNDYGQLGNGTIANPPGASNPTPGPVTGITGAAAVTGGGFHTCVRFPDGTLRCWGRNSEGQLGDPATTAFFSATSVPVTGISTALQVTAGGFHTCALVADGTVRCWGLNDFGQLGNGTVGPSNIPNPNPVTVSGITTATAVSGGGWHTCALLANGTVRCWGDNERGQIGDGSTVPPPPFVRRPTPTPVEVVGINTAVALESGIFHTCALLQNGEMRCWGWNTFGQLGNDPPANNASSTPVTVAGIGAPALMAPGAEHSCVLMPDGTIRCWGDNVFGQNGNGSPPDAGATNPGDAAPVTGISTATSVTSGAEHSCALFANGGVRCWGRGLFGRLGDGSTADEDAFTPVTVVGLGATWTSSDTSVATIDEGGLATGRAPGVTVITASSGDRSGGTTLTVEGTAPPQRTLAVTREGGGQGTVTSGDGAINCGTTCSAAYDDGTVVTLTAAPAAGSFFEGWTGGGCGTAPTCTVTLTADTTVSARFGIASFTLEVARDETLGSGTVTSGDGRINCGTACSAVYGNGTQVTLTATPDAGSTFQGWTGGGCSGTAPTCTVTVTANTKVTARFGVGVSTLSVARQGSGTVSSTPAGIDCGSSCSAAYANGTPVTLQATPGLLYFFVGWSGGGCSGTGTCTVTLRSNTTVTAKFRLLGLL